MERKFVIRESCQLWWRLLGTSQTIWNLSLNSHTDGGWGGGIHKDKTAGRLTELSTLRPSLLASWRLRLDWSHWKIVQTFAMCSLRRHALTIPREEKSHTCLSISNTGATGHASQLHEESHCSPSPSFGSNFKAFLCQQKMALSNNKGKLTRKTVREREQVIFSFKMYF